MQSIIACDDQAIAARLCQCLTRVGVDSQLHQVLTLDSALKTVENHEGDEAFIIFFGSEKLAPNELLALQDLCCACKPSFKVVVVGNHFSATSILQAVRNGAVDCLNLDEDFEGELQHLLERIRISTEGRARLGKLFTVVAPVGGSGASMVAINIAAVVAERQQRCGLLDLHVRGGSLSTLLNCTPRHNLLSLAGKTEQLDKTMLDQSLFKHPCGVHLLASGEPFSDWRQIRPELLHKVVQLTRSIYGTVVVDLEDCDHFDQVRTLASSDNIVVPLRPDFVSLVRTKKLLHFWNQANVSREHVTLVLNRVGQPKEIPLHLIEEALETKIRFQIADDPVAMNEAINLGVPLVTAIPKSKAAKSLVALADHLIGGPSQSELKASSLYSWSCGRHLVRTVRSAARLLGAPKPAAHLA